MANLKSLDWPFQADGNDHSKKTRMTILTNTRFFKEGNRYRRCRIPAARHPVWNGGKIH